LLSAPEAAILEALIDEPRIGALIVAARNFTDFAIKAILRGERVDPDSPQMRRYLALTLGGADAEIFLVVFCDGEGGFLASEIMGLGSEDRLDFPVRPIVSRAFDLGARGIMLAHNHPSGLAAPSEADRQETARMRSLCRPLGIEVLDHLIVARGQVFSMARERMI
jgi:DNA repair protein RadC